MSNNVKHRKDVYVWTDDRVAVLRKLFSQGLSYRDIGKQMKVSKNAVCTQCFELNLIKVPRDISLPPANWSPL